ncbi:MAG: hypothetical protein P8184_21495 [Calditrichia bacterium]
MLNKLCYAFLLLWGLTTLSFAQEDVSRKQSDGTQTSLQKRGFEIIHDREKPAIIEENGLATIQVRVVLHDQRMNKLGHTQQLINTELMTKGFEGDFPTGGLELVNDPTWGKDEYKPYTGNYSAWCAAGGANGLDPQYSDYPTDWNAMMIYGPFSLEGAGAAELDFYYWLNSEIHYDWFFYLASTDVETFYGAGISGNTQGWDFEAFDITNEGVFVDDISLNTAGLPTLTVDSPNGGETWEVSSNHTISWSTTGLISNVEIEYSTNGGSSWSTIISSTSNDATYSLGVPNTSSENCLVKIYDANKGDRSDEEILLIFRGIPLGRIICDKDCTAEFAMKLLILTKSSTNRDSANSDQNIDDKKIKT